MQEISQRKSKSIGEVKSETVTARIIALKLSGDLPNSKRAIFVNLQNEAPANNFATGTIESMSTFIEQELNRPSVINHKQTKISDNWLLQKSSFGLEIKKMVDIIWIYFQVTSHRTNGIPTGKTYTTICFDRHGEKLEIPGSEAQVMELAAQIHARVPWQLSATPMKSN